VSVAAKGGEGPGRTFAQWHVVLISVLTLTLLGLALGVTIASYETAVSAHKAGSAARKRNELVQRAKTNLWREREAMNEYLVTPRVDIHREVDLAHARFDRAIGAVEAGGRIARQEARRARSANALLFAEFRTNLAKAGRGAAPEREAIVRLNAREAGVLAPLDLLGPVNEREAKRQSRAGSSDDRRAFIAGLLAAVLAVGGGGLFVVSALRLVRRIRAQNEVLLEVDRMKDEFVASVTHELRTPLTSIRGYVELLQDGEAGELNAEQDQFLHVVKRNADRLLRVVGDLLFVAQVDAGRIALDISQTDLSELAADAIGVARPAADDKQIALVLDTPDGLEAKVDRERVAQVLDNLVANAVKFTPPGGEVCVRVSAAGDDTAVLEVADTGTGIPPEEQERLFERFFRTTGATRQAIPGTGLGLAIVQAIVDAHGGSISVESEAGSGTVFRVELPTGTERGIEPATREHAAA
jgi:signal transduction histidine kinase